MSKIKAWTSSKPKKRDSKRDARLEKMRKKLALYEKDYLPQELRQIQARQTEARQAAKLKRKHNQAIDQKRRERAQKALDNTSYSNKKAKVRFVKHNQ